MKQEGYKSTTRNLFDLLGKDETGLSKAFAYLLASERSILYRFLRNIGITANNTESNFVATSIEIERVRNEGRTDIEIRQSGKFHVIVECKVGKNRITQQRTQYLDCFEEAPQKVLCFITQERDNNLEISKDICIHYKGWLDIIDLLEPRDFEIDLIKEFASYATRSFKMRDQKEVLIQDLSDPKEIRRYKDNNIYRRNRTFGSPLYFAPYFTRSAQKDDKTDKEGITSLSKILGVLTVKPENVTSFEDELLDFADGDKKLVEKWLKGIEADTQDFFTYYFLAAPVRLDKPLLKDGGREIGRGKNWIAAMIPPNRCVTFEEFTKRIVDAAK